MRKTTKFALLASFVFGQFTALASQLPMPRHYPDHYPSIDGLWNERGSYGFYSMGEGLLHESGAALDHCSVTYKALLFKDPNNAEKATLYLKPGYYGFCDRGPLSEEDVLPSMKTVPMYRAGLRNMSEKSRWVGTGISENTSRAPYPFHYEFVLDTNGDGTLYERSVDNSSEETIYDLIFPLIRRLPNEPIIRDRIDPIPL